MKFLAAIVLILITAVFSISGQTGKTDREVDGLKGAVKSVLTERSDYQSLSKKPGKEKRRPESEITYDKNGSRLTWKTYDYRTGVLFDSVRYDLLDGDRVLIFERVDTPKLTSQAPDAKVDKSGDTRYTNKLKYKYDATGNVTEEAWYQNDGALWMRYVYNLKGNKKEELVYDKDGKLNQKIIHIYDDRQNEIESVFYDVKTDAPDGTEFFKYLEFDANGNWTKKIVSESDGKSRSLIQNREVLYRTLTYY